MSALIRASLRHYRALHALVAAGVAVAVAVLAGALIVGSSVRASLRDLALARLGATELVVSSTTFFRAALAADVVAQVRAASPQWPIDAVAVLAVTGTVSHEATRRTAGRVHVFGIDDRFLAFHGLAGAAPGAREAWISQALATELDAKVSDVLVLRVAKPTEIPLSSIQGRREDVSERFRLTANRIVDRADMGEFSLAPSQGPALAIFVPLSRLQQDLGVDGSANAILIRQAAPRPPPEKALLGEVSRAVSTAARLEDLGLRERTDAPANTWLVESRTALLPDEISAEASRTAASMGHPSAGALTYLANTIRVRGREIPYSLITAIDLDAYRRVASFGASAEFTAAPVPPPKTPHPPIWLNEWAVEDLGATDGDRVDIDYFLWSDQDGLTTQSAVFTFAGVVPMRGAGGDRTLTPAYPGITDAADVTSWDPPFPVDMRRVRKKDEDYWDTWRAAPKAFIPLEVGQRLWPSPFGTLSSWRAPRVEQPWVRPSSVWQQSGLTVRDQRTDALAAADGTTDFGEYFVYFSFFLVVSGLLLAGLFFALTVEQRAQQLGLLAAVGFRRRDIRRLLLSEAALVAALGSIVGIGGAMGYAGLIMYGLRTWWIGAVGTTALTLHVDPLMLAGGAGGALTAAVLALALSLRRIARRSTRTLLTAGLTESARDGGTDAPGDAGARPRTATRRSGVIAFVSIATAAVLMTSAIAGIADPVAAFFGAGGLLLVAGCAFLSAWLRRPAAASTPHSVARFGASYARWRPTRSVLSAALIAFACFVIVSVGAFRRDPAGALLERTTGTGGFGLMAESVAPLMHNPNTRSGREELGLADYTELDRARFTRFRLRPGDEASCLTLYQPRNPRLAAPEASFLDESRFAFSQSLAETDEERANPWLLLTRRFSDGAIPAIADQTSLQYVFHLRLGDDFVFTPEGGAPIRLRLVGALADSVLQSELIIGEADFVRLFPHHEGYRVWMIEAPESQAPVIAAVLEDRLSDYGLDVTDTRARLASYHQVENTYLSTFQALGALGLLLGTAGLAAVLARNVLERRRELGLLGAVGFTPRHLRTMITAESLVLVGSGVVIGTLAALVAIAPALAERGRALPFGALGLLLIGVVATGLAASFVAVRLATSTRVVDAMATE